MEKRLWRLRWPVTVWIAQLAVIGGLSAQRAIAQVIPDATTPTNAGVCGTVCTINGGTRNGANLFHSFRDFNVGTGQQVRFANPAGVETILSRVTGTAPSNILGILGVNGPANLFLLNPNGIVFGPNARLDVRGAFLATTADQFVFENGETFSATNPAVPLLTMNVPIGLQFGTRTPGSIINRGSLVVDSGQSLVLLGGELTLDQGGLFVAYPAGGRVDLGAVAGAGTVGLESTGTRFSLNFSANIPRADVRVINRAVVRAIANDSGSIAIHAQNLDILDGSLLQAGIGANQGTVNSQAGDITLNATGIIQMGQSSQVINAVYPNATGSSGAIRIVTGSLLLTDGAQLNANTFGRGNAGNIIVDARDRISVDGVSADGTLSTGASSSVGSTGVGAGGDINLNTGSLSLTNGGSLRANTFGQGNAGNVNILVRDTVLMDGMSSTGGLVSSIFSSVAAGGVGAGGNIRISTGSLSITNGASLVASTRNRGNAGNIFIDARDRVVLDGISPNGRFSSAAFSTVEAGGVGDGGNIHINTGSLSLTNGARLLASTRGEGNAGNIFLNARDRISLDGESRNGGFLSGAFSRVDATGLGEGGNIDINTGSLFLTNAAQLGVSTLGQGNAGNVTVFARDTIALSGTSRSGALVSSIASTVERDGHGAGGDIYLSTGELAITNGANLIASTRGRGNAGNIVVDARDRVGLDGTSLNGQFPSAAFSTVEVGGVGDGGIIRINTGSLSLTNGAQLFASTRGEGNAGSIFLNARDRVSFDGESGNGSLVSGAFSRVDATGLGEGGNIEINTGSLLLTNGAQLGVSTLGQGRAGNVTVFARDSIAVSGTSRSGTSVSSIASTVERTGVGAGGNIRINTGSISLTNGALLVASTRNQGNAGNIFIDARDRVVLNGTSPNGRFASGAFSTVEAGGVGNGGNIRINTGSLSLTNGAQLFASTRGQGNAGNVTVFARDTIALSGTNRSGTIANNIASTVERTGVGAGGNIYISTGSLSLMDGSALTASTLGQGNAGNISINARDRISLDRTDSRGRLPNGIFSSVARSGVGTGGDIDIHTNSLFVANGSVLTSGTFGQGDAGNIVVNAREQISLDGRSNNGRFATGASSRVERTGIGSGGNLYFNTRVLSLSNGALLVANTLGQGDAGNIVVNARDRISFDGSSRNGRIPTGAFSSVSETGVGAGGTMRFNTGLFSLTNGAQLSASTFGRGNSGDIIINARDGVSVAGMSRNGRFESAAFSRVSASGRGQGGDIRIATERLSIRNRAGLVSSSDGQGNAGNIRIAARAVHLDRGRIDATNASRNGGNVVLRDLDLLLLRRNSRISTEAGTANRGGGGNGGNIAIAANLIFAVPSENSDINANAFDGQGGTIDITTQGIFGIEPRLVASPLTSDITASSALGVNGVIDITAPDVDPRRGLTQLPATVADAANQIVQTCPTRGNAAERLSEFVITGRGGIPPNPADVLNGAAIVSHLSSLDESDVDQATGREIGEISALSTAPTPVMPESTATPSAPDVIREAQGWAVNQAGEITLVIDSPAIAPHSLAVANAHCGGSHS